MNRIDLGVHPASGYSHREIVIGTAPTASGRYQHGQRVERHEPVIGQRIVVDQEFTLADEKGPGSGDVEVIERLDGVGPDAVDPDDAAESGGGYRRA